MGFAISVYFFYFEGQISLLSTVLWVHKGEYAEACEVEGIGFIIQLKML